MFVKDSYSLFSNEYGNISSHYLRVLEFPYGNSNTGPSVGPRLGWDLLPTHSVQLHYVWYFTVQYCVLYVLPRYVPRTSVKISATEMAQNFTTPLAEIHVALTPNK